MAAAASSLPGGPVVARREALARGVMVVTLLLIPVVILMGVFGPKRNLELPGEQDSAILAFELATTAQEARQVSEGKDSDSWTRMRRAILLDFPFLLGYGLVFVFLGRLLASRDCPGCRVLGAAAIVLAASTAGADVVENLGILQVLGGNDGAVGWMRTASLWKWALYGLTALAVANAFFPRLPQDSGVKVFGSVIAVLYIVGGLAALYGVLLREAAISTSIPPVMLAFLLQWLLFWRRREEFMAGL